MMSKFYFSFIIMSCLIFNLSNSQLVAMKQDACEACCHRCFQTCYKKCEKILGVHLSSHCEDICGPATKNCLGVESENTKGE